METRWWFVLFAAALLAACNTVSSLDKSVDTDRDESAADSGSQDTATDSSGQGDTAAQDTRAGDTPSDLSDSSEADTAGDTTAGDTTAGDTAAGDTTSEDTQTGDITADTGGDADACTAACDPEETCSGSQCLCGTEECGPWRTCCDGVCVPDEAAPWVCGPAACQGTCGVGEVCWAARCLPETGVVDLALGSAHTCAVTAAKELLCWGNNGGGRLGTGDTSDHLSPTYISSLDPALTGKVVDVAAGQEHTCVVTDDQQVWCWGANWAGQLGIGSTVPSYYPMLVPSLTGAVAVTAGDAFTCALQSRTSQGTSATCWGVNNLAELGRGFKTDSGQTSAAIVDGDPALRNLSSSRSHSCAITQPLTGGLSELLCWGSNTSQECGVVTAPATEYVPSPSPNYAPDGIRWVAAGRDHTCIIEAGGAVSCFGNDGASWLTWNAQQPDRVKTSSGALFKAARIGAGHNVTCAVGIDDARAVSCWGTSDNGRLGSSSGTTAVPVPASLPQVRFADVAVGSDHACAFSERGALYCWGANPDGRLGLGSTSGTPVLPTLVTIPAP